MTDEGKVLGQVELATRGFLIRLPNKSSVASAHQIDGVDIDWEYWTKQAVHQQGCPGLTGNAGNGAGPMGPDGLARHRGVVTLPLPVITDPPANPAGGSLYVSTLTIIKALQSCAT